VSAWPSMGILCGSGFAGGEFSQDRRERKAAYDCGLTAAAAPDGLIEDWWVMPNGACRRWDETSAASGTRCSGERMQPGEDKDSHRITS